jgi:hypothetical protein
MLGYPVVGSIVGGLLAVGIAYVLRGRGDVGGRRAAQRNLTDVAGESGDQLNSPLDTE